MRQVANDLDHCSRCRTQLPRGSGRSTNGLIRRERAQTGCGTWSRCPGGRGRPQGLAACRTGHGQLVVAGGSGDDERAELDADEVGEVHVPTIVAAGHHRCGGVEGHRACGPGRDEDGPLGAGGGGPDPRGCRPCWRTRSRCRPPAHRTTANRFGVAGHDGSFGASGGVPDPGARSTLPETIQVPSGLTAQPPTASVSPVRMARFRPVAASQILRVRSALPETIQVPSGLTAQRKHPRLCGRGGRSFRPVAASQILRVRSALPETIQVPSGLTAQPTTPLVWPFRVARLRPWRRPKS